MYNVCGDYMQRYFAKEKIEKNFILDSDDIRHIRVVMRMKDNDEIIVVYEEVPYICRIENVNKEVEITIKDKLDCTKKNIPNVTLIIPILKEQKMDLILQKATELGVAEIIPFYADNSIIKAKEDKSDKKIDRWRRIVKEASEQAHRNNIPAINEIFTLNQIKKINGLNLICSTVEKSTNIKNVFTINKKCDRINLVIGPEGGLSKKEEKELMDNNFIPITLGNRIMRVETVPLFIMSVINYEFME